jgi:acyl-CoA hydrolase
MAINSVLEVDLFGQANAEFIRGRQVSGTGGLTDFLRGARASPGGIGMTALASTAKGGAISRIVPRLAPDATSVSRADMDVVITEHGVARLRGLDLDGRAAALIAIADPAHRDTLATAWDAMRRAL